VLRFYSLRRDDSRLALLNVFDGVDLMSEYTGGSVSYYSVLVEKPTLEGRDPYTAECNDIIESLGMNYAEGNAFKALWRRAAARTLGMAKAGYKDGLYDAEKVEFFGARLVAQSSIGYKPKPAQPSPAFAEKIKATELADGDLFAEAPEWAGCIVERLGVSEFAETRSGGLYDENGSRFVMTGEDDNSPWRIIAYRTHKAGE